MNKTFNIILLFSFLTYGQKEHSYWYFGNQLGLHFNTVNNINLLNDSSLDSNNIGTASISDCNGTLLFYTNGLSVYTRNHQLMDGATNLIFGNNFNNVTIIKKPGNNNLYYIITFNNKGEMSEVDYYGVYYHIVDMDQNAGYGKIIQKNIMLTVNGSYKLAVAKKKDSEEIWLISFNFSDKQFDVYLITETGVSLTSSYPSGDNTLIGLIKFNSDFTQFVATNQWESDINVLNNTSNAFTIYDFDNELGVILSKKNIGYEYYRIPRGAEFSPNGRFLYVSYSALPFYPPSGNYFYYSGSLIQYDLYSTDIEINKKTIKKDYYFSPFAMQLGINNKIYISNFRKKSLAAISNPNLVYPDCNFESESLFFEKNVREYVPNITKIFQKVKHTVQNQCEGYTTEFNIDYGGSVIWNFGDGTTAIGNNVTHNYTSAGIYNVVINNVSTICNKFTIEIFPVPKQNLVPTEMSICGNLNSITSLQNLKEEIIVLQNNHEFEILCYTNQNDCLNNLNEVNEINLLSQQIIYFKIRHKRNKDCYINVSTSLIGYQIPQVELSPKYFICNQNSLQLIIPSIYDSYLWSTGGTSNSIEVLEPGNYEVTVSENHIGKICSLTLSTQVYPSESPIITNIDVHDLSSHNNSIEILVTGNGNYEYSLDNIYFQSSNIFENVPAGIQQIWVNDKNGCGKVTKDVILLSYAKYFSPNHDGINDKWYIQYSFLEENIQVSIFDRYNKLLKTISKREPFWDGTYNGELLPADDYWFVITRNNGKQYKGHFALIR